MEPIQSIPGKMSSQWDAHHKAVIDTWESYFVTLDAFREAVLVKGLGFARAHGGRAWIVDSSKAKGAFSQDVQTFIGEQLFKEFARAGIRYFIPIKSQSAVTNMTITSYASQVGPAGIELVELPSVQDALAWISSRKAA